MIPPTPSTDAPMNVLTREDIHNLSNNGMSTNDITRLLVPTDVATMAATHVNSST